MDIDICHMCGTMTPGQNESFGCRKASIKQSIIGSVQQEKNQPKHPIIMAYKPFVVEKIQRK